MTKSKVTKNTVAKKKIAKTTKAAKSAASSEVLFEKDFLVHFADCDPQGIVFFARYFDWAHAVIEEFWAAKRGGWQNWFQNKDFAVPLRHAEANYLSPVIAGEQVTAHLTVARIGETSVAFETQFSAGGRPAAAVKTVHVFVGRRDFRATAVPKEVVKNLRG